LGGHNAEMRFDAFFFRPTVKGRLLCSVTALLKRLNRL
jgi:hypothetical protein